MCVHRWEYMCVVLNRRCLWQLPALFEQQSQSAAAAAKRVVVTALVGDSLPSLPRSPPCTFCSSSSSSLRLSLTSPRCLSSPPSLSLLLLLRFSLQLKWLALHQFHRSWGRIWIDSPSSPGKLLQLQISFRETSKRLHGKPWKQGVPVPLFWSCVAPL